jgi:hypothetical protein
MSVSRTKSWPGVLATAVVLSALAANLLHGQESELSKGAQVWFRGGYGPPTAIELELAAQYSFFIVEGRLTQKEVIADEANGLDAGLLVGLAIPAYELPYFHVSATIGLAATWFESGYESCQGCPQDLGATLVFGVHVAVRPTSFLGLGLFDYWNRNSERPFHGSGVMIELGRLR